MRKLWLLVAQAVTVGVVVFVIATLVAPESLPWRARTMAIGRDSVPAVTDRRDAVASYSTAAKRAAPSVVSVYAMKASRGRVPGTAASFTDPDEDPGGGGLGSGRAVLGTGKRTRSSNGKSVRSTTRRSSTGKHTARPATKCWRARTIR
jgi:S1-C subfamily serine protease